MNENIYRNVLYNYLLQEGIQSKKTYLGFAPQKKTPHTQNQAFKFEFFIYFVSLPYYYVK